MCYTCDYFQLLEICALHILLSCVPIYVIHITNYVASIYIFPCHTGCAIHIYTGTYIPHPAMYYNSTHIDSIQCYMQPCIPSCHGYI